MKYVPTGAIDQAQNHVSCVYHATYRIGNKVSILSGPSPKQNRKFINFKFTFFPGAVLVNFWKKELVTGSGLQRA